MDKNSIKTDRLLTEAELEVMREVWALGEASVGEVLECLAKSRQLAYTSVSTIMRILEKKGFLDSRKVGRAHLYRPLVERQVYEQRSLSHMVDSLFQGNPVDLVSRFIDSAALNDGEIERIRRLLEEKKQR